MFRGFVWDKSQKEGLTDNSFSIKCYDQLIYWQESEGAYYFTADKTTEEMLDKIASQWRIKINYVVKYVRHGIREAVVARGNIADIITSDILQQDDVQFGVHSIIIRSMKNEVYLMQVGTNETVYTLSKGCNVAEIRKFSTMSGVITRAQVVSTDPDDTSPTYGSYSSALASKYGTLVKNISQEEDMTYEKAQEAAKEAVSGNDMPKWEFDVKSVDVPWIRKGDKVNIETDTLNGSFWVKSISREISNRGKNMSMTVVSISQYGDGTKS